MKKVNSKVFHEKEKPYCKSNLYYDSHQIL